MVGEPEFPGSAYDVGRAEAIADAMRAVLVQARLFDVDRIDLLAAVGILAAQVIAASKLRTRADQAVDRLADFTRAWAARLAAEPRHDL